MMLPNMFYISVESMSNRYEYYVISVVLYEATNGIYLCIQTIVNFIYT